MKSSLFHRVLSNNVTYAFVGEIAAKLSPLATYWAVAEFLSPQDFGVYSTFLIITAGCALMWEGGLAKAVIKLEDGKGLVASNAFLINQGLALALAFFLLMFSEIVSSFFLASVQFSFEIRLAAFYVILSSVSSIPICLLQKEARFGVIAKIRLVLAVVPILVTVPLVVFFGLKHLALIYGLLVAQLVQLLMLSRMSKWRPKFGLSKEIILRLFRFSKWVIFSSIAAWIFAWGDSIFVVKILTIEDLGLFRMASHLVLMGYMLVFSPLLPLLYSRLVKFKNYDDASLVQLLTVVSFGVAMLITVLFAVVGPLIFSLLKSDAWEGLMSLIIMASLTQIIPYIFVFMGEFYRGANVPRLEAMQRLVSVLALGIFFAFCTATTLQSFMEQRLILTFITGIFELVFVCWFLAHVATYTAVSLLIAVFMITLHVFFDMQISVFLVPIFLVFAVLAKKFRKLGFLLD